MQSKSCLSVNPRVTVTLPQVLFFPFSTDGLNVLGDYNLTLIPL